MSQQRHEKESITIRVNTCYDCPFRFYSYGTFICRLTDHEIIHQNPVWCPLNYSKVIVKKIEEVKS